MKILTLNIMTGFLVYYDSLRGRYSHDIILLTLWRVVFAALLSSSVRVSRPIWGVGYGRCTLGLYSEPCYPMASFTENIVAALSLTEFHTLRLKGVYYIGYLMKQNLLGKDSVN